MQGMHHTTAVSLRVRFNTIFVQKALLCAPMPTKTADERVSAANGLVDIRPAVPFRITVAQFADKDVTLAKNEVLVLALQDLYKVFAVNVDPREREAVATAKVGLAQALQPDDALTHSAQACIHHQRYVSASRPRMSRWTMCPMKAKPRSAPCSVNSRTCCRANSAL